MKNIKILSILMATIVSLGVLVGCGEKDNSKVDANNPQIEQEENQEPFTPFDKLPENKIVPEWVKSKYANYEETVSNYDKFFEIFWHENDDKEFREKHGFTDDLLAENYDVASIQKANPEMYEGAIISALIGSIKMGETLDATNEMMLEIQNYLAATLLQDKNEDYHLAPEFKELKPIETVKKYTESNKIEISEVNFPTDYKNMRICAGTMILTVDVGIIGTVDGEDFDISIPYDIHFVPREDLREGAVHRKTDFLSIMAVTSSVPYGTDSKFDCEYFFDLMK